MDIGIRRLSVLNLFVENILCALPGAFDPRDAIAEHRSIHRVNVLDRGDARCKAVINTIDVRHAPTCVNKARSDRGGNAGAAEVAMRVIGIHACRFTDVVHARLGGRELVDGRCCLRGCFVHLCAPSGKIFADAGAVNGWSTTL